jgi:C4-dicarboxylate transporter, DctQ subunit
MRVFKKVGDYISFLVDALAFVAGALMLLLMLYVCADVAARYFGDHVLPFTVDISNLLLLSITFFVVARVQKSEGHVRMDFLLSRFNEEHRALISVITTIMCAVMCVVLTWYGSKVALNLALKGIHTQTEMVIPEAPIIAIIPFGFFLLFIQLLRTLHGHWVRFRILKQSKGVMPANLEKEITGRDVS